MPGVRRSPPRSPLLPAEVLRRAIRSERATATRAVRQSIVSLAGLLGEPVPSCACPGNDGQWTLGEDAAVRHRYPEH
jgi:hypothetical protein